MMDARWMRVWITVPPIWRTERFHPFPRTQITDVVLHTRLALMTTTNLTQESFVPVADPAIYSGTSYPAAVDSATNSRITKIHPATGGIGAATLAAPLNSGVGATTNFHIDNTGNSRMRWGTSAIRVSMVFHLGNNTAAAAPITRCSPSWNLVFQLIRSLTCVVNENKQVIDYSQDGSFNAAMMAKILRFFDRDTVNGMDQTLFTPLNGPNDSYTIADVADAQYVVGVNDGCLARANRWMGANSHMRVVTKLIPLSLLVNAPDACWYNAEKFDFSIQWAPTTDLLESANVVGVLPDGTRGGVSVIACDFLEDAYVMSPITSAEKAAGKAAGKPDILPFLVPEVRFMAYQPNAPITLNGITNVDAIMILQPARGFVNGQAGVNARLYTSAGETLIFGNSAGPAGLMLLHADQPITAGYASPITTMQIDIGNVHSPELPSLTTRTTNATVCLEPAELYYMYQKACAKVTRTEALPAITEGMYKSTLPVVAVRPWGDASMHLSSEGSTVNIMMNGGVASTVAVVIFRLKTFSIRADTNIVESWK